MRNPRSLPRGDDFDRVYREGLVIAGPFFVVRSTNSPGGEGGRWGFAAGKRTFRSAVERNRVRRRLREAVRAAGVGGGRDWVVTARKGVEESTVEELAGAMRSVALRTAKRGR